MTTGALIARAAQHLCNEALRLDPETAERLAADDGAVVDVTVEPLPPLRVTVHGERVAIDVADGDGTPPADLVVRAPVSALLADARSVRGAPVPGTVSVRGDALLADRLGAVARGLRVDWEEGLARVLGDAAGHEAARRLRDGAAWGRRTGGALLADADEFLREEIRVAASHHEVERFGADVDAMRDAVERLEARVARLAARGHGPAR